MTTCGCPKNEVGDIRCHVCGEYVNKRCWACKTPRGEGPCPNPAPPRTGRVIFVPHLPDVEAPTAADLSAGLDNTSFLQPEDPLAEFLLDRIAEDELEVGPADPDEGAGPNGIGWAEVGALSEVLMVRPSRVLAECEAKQKIVSLHMRECGIDPECGHLEKDGWCMTMYYLASVYAGPKRSS